MKTSVIRLKVVVAVVSILLVAKVSVAASELKIATVDMKRALQTVEAGKKAKGKLESDFNKKKQELQKEEGEIRKMAEELKNKSLVMNEESRNKKQAELNERIMALQQLTAQSQMEIQKKEQEMTIPIVDKLKTIIKDMAAQKGYNMVLEKDENMVLFSEEKDDLTEEVIKSFNGKNKG